MRRAAEGGAQIEPIVDGSQSRAAGPLKRHPEALVIKPMAAGLLRT
jgi:hypothetical protein